MKEFNPFQVPGSAIGGDIQKLRRERFKKVFIAVLIAHIVPLLVGLLLQGCGNSHHVNSNPPASSIATPGY